MRMRVGFWILAALCVVAVAMLWLRGEEDPPTTVDSDSATETAAHDPALIGRPDAPSPATPAAPEAPPPQADELAASADPIEKGTCAVHVTLVDAATQQPAKSTAQLWRLDAPGNANFERGDQLQQLVNIAAAGHTFEGLAVGTYRIHAEHQRAGSDDPPAFVVRSAADRVRLSVLLPRQRLAWLEVYDEDGRPLTVARSSGPRKRYANSTSSAPSWPVRRKRKGKHSADTIGIGGGAGGTFSGRHRPYELRAQAEGFPLGSVLEPTRRGTQWNAYRLLFDGRSLVDVHARFHADRVHVFRAVSVPMAIFHDAVLLPDGSRARDHRRTVFSAACDATLAEPYEIFDARDHVVNVTVTLVGYDKLEFEYRPGRRLPTLTLVPTR